MEWRSKFASFGRKLRENEFFLGTLLFITLFFLLLYAGQRTILPYLFPLTSFFVSTFYYNLHDHLEHSQFHTPVVSFKPFGKTLTYGRLNLITAFMQMGVIFAWIQDMKANYYSINLYGGYYFILEVILFSCGILIVFILRISAPEFKFHEKYGDSADSAEEPRLEKAHTSGIFLPLNIRVLSILLFSLNFLLLLIFLLHSLIEGWINSTLGTLSYETTIFLTGTDYQFIFKVSVLAFGVLSLNIISMVLLIGWILVKIKRLNANEIIEKLKEKNISHHFILNSILENIAKKD